MRGPFSTPITPLPGSFFHADSKAVSVHWELMFTRSLFGTPDMAEQGRLLDTVAELVDASRIRTTATETLSPISAATLTEAHRRIESATTRGKIVLEGWEPRHD